MDSNKYLKHYLKSKNKPIYGIDECDTIQKLQDRIAFHTSQFEADHDTHRSKMERKLFIPPYLSSRFDVLTDFHLKWQYSLYHVKPEMREWGTLYHNIRVFIETADMNKYKFFKSLGLPHYRDYCFLLIKETEPDQELSQERESCYIFSMKVEDESTEK